MLRLDVVAQYHSPPANNAWSNDSSCISVYFCAGETMTASMTEEGIVYSEIFMCRMRCACIVKCVHNEMHVHIEMRVHGEICV